MKFVAIDHVMLAMPPGGEDLARGFYRDALGLSELPKPPALAARAGAWFGAGSVQLHLGIEQDFRAARKAHPAIRVELLDRLAERLTESGFQVDFDEDLPGHRRFYVSDPFGNRLEFLEPEPA
jgi:catechol 2,3-dioxygenase-like lactoylglutathione lyase family enzyme